MKKTALFSIAAVGIAAAGVPQAFATPTLTVGSNGGTPVSTTFTELGSGSYYINGGTFGDFTWSLITAQVSDPSTSGKYQLTLTVNGLREISSSQQEQTITFIASDSGFGPVNAGIASIQGNTTLNITGGTSTESSSSYGVLNPSPGTSTGTLTYAITTTPNLQSPTLVGSVVNTNPLATTGSFTLQTSDSLDFNPGSTGSFVSSISSTITATPAPEPNALAIFAAGGLAILAGFRRRKSKAQEPRGLRNKGL